MKVSKARFLFLTMLLCCFTVESAFAFFNPRPRSETEIVSQFHGDMLNNDLVLFMAGNQFVVMDNLIYEFQQQYPQYEKIFYVTIPPGQLRNWIKAGGSEWYGDVFPGDPALLPLTQMINPNNPEEMIDVDPSTIAEGFQMTVLPDVFTTVALGHMNDLANNGFITRYYSYAHNRLVLMVDGIQENALKAIADGLGDGLNAAGELTALGLYRLMSSDVVTISEPDIITQGIERHIWRMYTNATKLVFDCNGTPDQDICRINQETFPGFQANNDLGDNCADLRTFFDTRTTTDDGGNTVAEPDESLRKIVYFSKRFNEGDCSDLATPLTLVTNVHHIETPANIKQFVDPLQTPNGLILGPVWGTEIEYQNNRVGNPDLIAIEVEDAVGLDGKKLNRNDAVNYLATIVDGTINTRHKQAALDFLEFLRSDRAQQILINAGFIGGAVPPNDNFQVPFIYPDSNPNNRVGNY